MKTFHIYDWSARQKGAAGYTYRQEPVFIDADTYEEARSKLYDTYEHITINHWEARDQIGMLVEPEKCARFEFSNNTYIVMRKGNVLTRPYFVKRQKDNRILEEFQNRGDAIMWADENR